MPYIGDTPWKKLKKLFILSSELIKHYGIRYFFYVVKLEYSKVGKEKFIKKVFLPDARPLDAISNPLFQEQYTKLLGYFKEKFTNELLHEKEFSYLPTVRIVIIFNKNNIAQLQHTINSLQNQSYQNWDVLLFSSDLDNEISLPPQINEISKISISKSKGKFLKFYKEVIDGKYDLIGFLEPGNLLDSFALSQFVLKLNKNKECDILYSDNDTVEGGIRQNPFFKPNWSPYLQNSMNYLSSLCLIKKELFEKISLESKYLDCMEYDVILKCVEKSDKIFHIPLPLCSVQGQDNSKYYISSQKLSLTHHLKRMNIFAEIENGIVKNTFRINYKLQEKPKVSIIIPTKNNLGVIKRCIESIQKQTKYPNIEIIIVDNASDKKEVTDYYKSLSVKILTYTENFNFSKINNFAVEHSTGDLLLFLNDDTKVLDPFWLDELVSICLQKDVGVVGAKLIFFDNTIQHAGMVFLKTGAGFHPAMRQNKNSDVYHNTVNVMKDCSAVTGACLLTTKKIFKQVGGFDNQFDIYYGDSDLCLKIQDAGYRIVYTPFTELLHDGSSSILYWHAGVTFFDVENHQAFIKKWPKLKNGDPYYNPNLDWDYTLQEIMTTS